MPGFKFIAAMVLDAWKCTNYLCVLLRYTEFILDYLMFNILVSLHFEPVFYPGPLGGELPPPPPNFLFPPLKFAVI